MIGRESQAEALVTLKRMGECLRHRGPDDQGLWAGEGVAFGMNRLSIVDLELGHQPMWTTDGVGIVFNGELYNYKIKRRELEEKLGYSFKTKSDTEVVLNLYHAYDLDFFDHLQGMFGLCVIDLRKSRVLLGRDRLGIKPLYYYDGGDRFLFASEIKAILAGLSLKPQLNLQAIHDYLTLRYVPGPETIWRGIQKLQPGHFLTFDLNTRKQELESYWYKQFQGSDEVVGVDYDVQFSEIFLNCVGSHQTVSDVPVGVLLSGGLDSSSVAAAVSELGHKHFHTFHVHFSDPGAISEASYARQVAKHLGTQHHEIAIGVERFLEFVPSYVKATDEPIADLAGIPLYFVAQLAKQWVKVVLSGEGADEILAGYDLDRVMQRYERAKRILGKVGKNVPLPLLRAGSEWVGKPYWVLGSKTPERYFELSAFHITRHFEESEKASLWKKKHRLDSTLGKISSLYSAVRSSHPLDKIQQVYCDGWLVEDLLMKADKMTMANSLELRVPFLDHELVEWAQKSPVSVRIGKRVLRRWAKKRLPDEILNRPKQGFPVPAYRWLKEDPNVFNFISGKLLGHQTRLLELFEADGIRHVLEQSRKGHSPSAHKVWVLYILEEWFRKWT